MNRQRKKVIGVSILLSAALLATCGLLHAADKQPKRPLLRVGVYDSRGVVMAYVHSDYNDHFMAKTSQRKKEAEAKGDLKTASRLDEQMKQYSLKRHKQGFGTVPVHELIEHVKDRLPTLAEQTGVDVIVSKWEMDHLAEDAETVDVTLEMAGLFNPKPGTDEDIKKLMRIEPMQEAEIERLERDHPH